MNEFINENGLLDVTLLPLSSNDEERTIQEKIINGEKLSFNDNLRLRDRAVTNLCEYNLLSDHMYRATSYNSLLDYLDKGYINDDKGLGTNRLVHWYLGGTSKRYGKVIIEAEAIPAKSELSTNYGGLMSGNPYVRHVTTTQDNPISMDEVSRIFFLDYTGEKVLKVIDLFNVKDINIEARIGSLLHQIDYLNTKKEIYKDSFIEDELLNNLNVELESLNKEITNKKAL